MTAQERGAVARTERSIGAKSTSGVLARFQPERCVLTIEQESSFEGKELRQLEIDRNLTDGGEL